MITLGTPLTAYTLSEHQNIRQRIRCGQITADEVRHVFERAVASEAEIRSELSAKTLKQLAPNGCRGMTKGNVVKAILSSMLDTIVGDSYMFSPMEETQLDGQRRALAKLTDEVIKRRAQERTARVAELRKAVTDPQTEAEFNTFISYKGEAALTPEQRARWDAIKAAGTLATLQRQREQNAAVEKVDLGDIQITLREGWHSKHNCKLWIVQLTDKVGRLDFMTLCAKARRLGGNYSSFGTKDTHGFQFREADKARDFMGLRHRDVDQTQAVREQQETSRENTVERLRDNARLLEERATEHLNAPRQDNTARRANMAASVEADCRSQIRMAHTMIRIADAIDRGEATHLKDLRHKTQIESLEMILRHAMYKADQAANRRHEECWGRDPTLEDVNFIEVFPWPAVFATTLMEAIKAMREIPGCIMLCDRLARVIRDRGGLEQTSFVFTADLIDDLKDLCQKALDHQVKVSDSLHYALTEYKRQVTMNVVDIHTLRAAIREYIPLRRPAIKADPTVALQRKLVGVKIPGYFPTPEAVVDRMISEAGLQPGMMVLEPSAGSGHIADAIRAEGILLENLVCFEISSTLRQILVYKQHQLRAGDYMEYDPTESAESRVWEEFDRVLMNPPFENGQDIEHVIKAYKHLREGGRIVAIMSRGPFFHMDKKAVEFRSWLSGVGGLSEELPDGSFEDSDRSTGVSTHIVVIIK